MYELELMIDGKHEFRSRSNRPICSSQVRNEKLVVRVHVGLGRVCLEPRGDPFDRPIAHRKRREQLVQKEIDESMRLLRRRPG